MRIEGISRLVTFLSRDRDKNIIIILIEDEGLVCEITKLEHTESTSVDNRGRNPSNLGKLPE